ncbi:hypothetical protein AVEN_131355-1 [Araneus ventricosus]|uniref:Uncharacterized protein n=1 Tax=Araneus ventricosus TaxID=182803 RepID=A0A4Y2R3F1_ARAVE|nr:hypothetical protein AVEN_131355-1 [Araneus ventricosus]
MIQQAAENGREVSQPARQANGWVTPWVTPPRIQNCYDPPVDHAGVNVLNKRFDFVDDDPVSKSMKAFGDRPRKFELQSGDEIYNRPGPTLFEFPRHVHVQKDVKWNVQFEDVRLNIRLKCQDAKVTVT